MKRISTSGILFIVILLVVPFVPNLDSLFRGKHSGDFELEYDIEKWGGTIVYSDGIAVQGNIRHIPRQEFLAKAFYRIMSRDPKLSQVWKDTEGYKIIGSNFIWTYNPLID